MSGLLARAASISAESSGSPSSVHQVATDGCAEDVSSGVRLKEAAWAAWGAAAGAPRKSGPTVQPARQQATHTIRARGERSVVFIEMDRSTGSPSVLSRRWSGRGVPEGQGQGNTQEQRAAQHVKSLRIGNHRGLLVYLPGKLRQRLHVSLGRIAVLR